MIAWFATRIGRYMALVGAVLVAAWGLVAYGRKTGADGAKIEALQKNQKAQEAGRNAVAKEKRETADASNADIVERMRERDGQWM